MTWKGWIGIRTDDAMKKIYSSILLLPLFYACEQEDFADAGLENNVTSIVSFEAEIRTPITPVQMNASTRTYLGDKNGTYYPNYWAEGDVISVNGVTSEPLAEYSEYVGTSKASFDVKSDVVAPYYFTYPSTAISNYNNGSAVVTLPEKQEWLSATYDPSSFLMMGMSDTKRLEFTPMMSAVRLNITSSHNSLLKSITFMTLGDEKVSGEFITDFSNLTGTSAAHPYVHLIAPAGGVEFGAEVYLLIPAQTYASGMAFAIRAADGTQMIYSTKSSFSAQAGKIYPLNVSYVPEISDITLMSSNIRYASARNKNDNPDTGDRDWTNRRSAYYTMLNTLKPDIVGLQEAEQEQVVDIKNNCSGYSHVGYGRKSGKDITTEFSSIEQMFGKKHGESTTILYKTDKFKKHSEGWFCHSDTPDKADTYFPGTEDEQPRISTWVILTHKDTGRKFFYLNTHTCLYDEPMQKEIKLIRDKVAELNTEKLPVILSGDWNLSESDSWMKPITDNYQSARITAPVTDDCYTYHWWESTSDKKQIDHIYYLGLECFEFHTVNQTWDNLYISDHYPVYAKFNLQDFTIPVYTETVEGNAGRENYNSISLF